MQIGYGRTYITLFQVFLFSLFFVEIFGTPSGVTHMLLRSTSHNQYKGNTPHVFVATGKLSGCLHTCVYTWGIVYNTFFFHKPDNT